MENLFECKVKYQKINESGKHVNVKETYLQRAGNFADAENRITEELKDYTQMEQLTVVSIKTTKFTEVMRGGEDGKWYKCKAEFISFDENTGKEKKASQTILVEADDADKAYKKLEKELKNSVAEFTIKKIEETAITEFYE